ncbi:MAG: selenocysteine-specific translation factor [Planctomycetota bacterium]|nr:MAG: selenocysteine-specific translation factor [Planctomycetota bacterium]
MRTMVAGASGIDLALLVVAADDAVMPQTREHLDILDLLGVRRGVVALTKIDIVDEETAALAAEDVRELLAGSGLAGAPICPVSSVTGAGLDELKRALLSAAEGVPEKPRGGPFRMTIDRVFTVAGRGTVVTGSVLRGTVREGDVVEVLPAGHTCRVRGLQSHGKEAVELEGGRRAALNLSGVERDSLARGMELAAPGYLTPTRMIDAEVVYLSSNARPLPAGRTVRLEIGTRELRVRIVFHGDKELSPGGRAFARLRSGEPFTAAYGQRFILRDETATRTLGGGVVLRPVVPRRRSGADEADRLRTLRDGDPAERVAEVLRLWRFDPPQTPALCAQAGVEPEAVPEILASLKQRRRYVPIGDNGTFVVPQACEEVRERMVRWMRRFHEIHPDQPGKPVDSVVGYLDRLTGRNLGRALFEDFERQGVIRRRERFVSLKEFSPSLSAADQRLLSEMVEEIRRGGFQPPLLDALSIKERADRKRWERLASLAVASGELVPIAPKLYLHRDWEARLRQQVAELIRSEGGVTVAQVREALQSSRKYVVPFLEYLDRIGWTKRSGDLRYLAGAAEG